MKNPAVIIFNERATD